MTRNEIGQGILSHRRAHGAGGGGLAQGRGQVPVADQGARLHLQ